MPHLIIGLTDTEREVICKIGSLLICSMQRVANWIPVVYFNTEIYLNLHKPPK